MSRTEIMKWIEYEVGSALLCDENPMDHWEPAEQQKDDSKILYLIFNIRMKIETISFHNSFNKQFKTLSEQGREMMPKSMHK